VPLAVQPTRKVMVVVPPYVRAGSQAKASDRKQKSTGADGRAAVQKAPVGNAQQSAGSNNFNTREEDAVEGTSGPAKTRVKKEQLEVELGTLHDTDDEVEEVEDPRRMVRDNGKAAKGKGKGKGREEKREADMGAEADASMEEVEVTKDVTKDERKDKRKAAMLKVEGEKRQREITATAGEAEEEEATNSKEAVRDNRTSVEEQTNAMDVDHRRRSIAKDDDDEWEQDEDQDDADEDQRLSRPAKRCRSKDEESGDEDGDTKAESKTKKKKKKQRLMDKSVNGPSVLVTEVVPRPSEVSKYTLLTDFSSFCTKCKQNKRECWARNGGGTACLSCHRGHRGLCSFSSYVKGKAAEHADSTADEGPKPGPSSKRAISVKPDPQKKAVSVKGMSDTHLFVLRFG
jgi:hypothetical protein